MSGRWVCTECGLPHQCSGCLEARVDFAERKLAIAMRVIEAARRDLWEDDDQEAALAVLKAGQFEIAEVGFWKGAQP